MEVRFLGIIFLLFSFDALAKLSDVELGQYLFFEKRLSIDNSVSCSTCHNPNEYYTVNTPSGRGINNFPTDRNPPVIFNRPYKAIQFWDGRAPNLEAQALMPLMNPFEMGSTDLDSLAAKMNKIPFYKNAFQEVYNSSVTADLIARSIAIFETTLTSYNAPYDQYLKGNKNALNRDQLKGMDLFFNKFKCQSCHDGINFTNDKLTTRCYPVMAKALLDAKKVKRSFPQFKVPTLRNVEKTAPYFHSGGIKTLDEAIEFYNDTGKTANTSESDLKNIIKLNKEDIHYIKEFLKSLTGPPITLKKLPPIN